MNGYLDKNTESRLVAIANKRYYRVALLSAGWIFAVLFGWLAFMIFGTRSFSLVPNYIPLLLLIVPFFPFSAHKVILSKTFYATVDHKVSYTQFQQLKEAYVSGRPDTVEALSVKFRSDDGKEFSVIYKKKNYVMDGIHYEEGDRVLFVRGLKYPFKFPITDEVERTCPVCGRTIAIEQRVCGKCNFDYSKVLRQ